MPREYERDDEEVLEADQKAGVERRSLASSPRPSGGKASAQDERRSENK